MLNNRIKTALAVLAASAGLAGCTSLGPYGGVGVGVGTGYGSPYGYGYGRPYGYGSPYGYDSAYGYDPYGYYNPYYAHYAGYPYYGWYNGFYYPGSGYWLYDPYGRRYPIADNKDQKSYWSGILNKIRQERGAQVASNVQQNWSGFSKEGKVSVDTIAEARAKARADRRALEQIAKARRDGQVGQLEQQQQRSESRGRRITRQQVDAGQSAAAIERRQARQQAQAEQRAARAEQQQAHQDSIRQRIIERRRARASSDE